MRFQRRRVAAALAQVLGGTALITGIPADAQDIVRYVTGSNIPRVESETAAPIEVMTRKDIEETGLQTISAVVRQITANNQSSIADSFTNGFSFGGSAVSLRGLGSNNTLVLVNGRRLAVYGLADDGHASYVDLQQIPMDAVERIEILKDGASAIYGSDAVAGVVNLILRQTFAGVTATGTAGTNYKGNGDQYQGAVTVGAGDLTKDRYNAYVSISAQQQDASPRYQGRDYIGTQDLRFMGLPDARPGNPQLPYGTGTLSGVVRSVNPTTGGSPGPFTPLPNKNCAPVDVDENGFCRYNPQTYMDLQPEVQRYNLYGRGSFMFTDTTQGYAELSWFQVKTHTRNTPTPLRSTAWWNPSLNQNNSTSNTFLPVGHPDNPFNAQNLGARIYYTSGDIGGRDSDVETNTQRYVVGLKGANAGWNWDAGAAYISSETDITRYGFVQYDRLLQAYQGQGGYGYYRIGANAGLNDPGIYPWLSPPLEYSADSKLTLVDAKASRDLMKLDGGQLALAVGAEYRHEKIDYPGVPGTDVGNIVGLGYSAAVGSRNIWAGYAELYVPLLKNLEISAAIRYDDYSDAGSTWNPKVGVKWTVVPQLLARGTYATGFRAPGLFETSTLNATAGFTTATDPVRCPTSPADCNVQVLGVNTGNPFIKPEKSTSWTVGAIWEPIPGLSGSLDYWNFEVKDQITIGSVQAVLNNPSAFPAAVVGRDNSNALPGIPNSGPVLYVQTPFQNANVVKTDGIDVDLLYRWNMKEYGNISTELQWTHIFNFSQTLEGIKYKYEGTHGNYDYSSGSATPEDRANLIIGWDQGPWNITGTVRYVSDYKSIVYQGSDECIVSTLDGPDCHVSSFTTLDLAASYKGFKNWEIFGSIINVFNRYAPFNPAAAYGPGQASPNFNYNYAFSGGMGTFFNLGFRYTFQ